MYIFFKQLFLSYCITTCYVFNKNQQKRKVMYILLKMSLYKAAKTPKFVSKIYTHFLST